MCASCKIVDILNEQNRYYKMHKIYKFMHNVIINGGYVSMSPKC